MAFWDAILRRNQLIAAFTPRVEYIGGGPLDDVAELLGLDGNDFRNASVGQLWRTQPHLRTVVSFLARNVAQLGMHVFERVNETDRRRDRTSPAARALMFPDTNMTTYEMVYALVGDMMLYDRAYWFVGSSLDTRSGWLLRRIPPCWVSPIQTDPFTVGSYQIVRGAGSAVVPASSVLDFTGYSPTNPLTGSPTVEALRDTLQEQIQAALYRAQVWKRGGRVSAVLQRPKDSPWSDAARESFRDDWYAKYTGSGSKAGGTPILEDGMSIQRIDFNAQEQQFVEAAKLSMQTVASAFHTNPTMIGILDNANYSNVREFRSMLYGDTLGPLLAQIEARVNSFLLPILGMDPEQFYVEFNIAEKLQGSFEEQAAAFQSYVGRPLMTADEARAKLNMPALGGDANLLVTPLNVLVGGQASPNDTGTQNVRSGVVETKAAPSDPMRAKAEQAFLEFFEKQERSVRSRMGAKAPDWWDTTRWNKELSGILYGLAVTVSSEIGQSTAKSLGFTPGDYDIDRTYAFLQAVSDDRAAKVNDVTMTQLDAALASDTPADQIDSTWTVAKQQRSGAAASAILAMAAGFGTVEATKQVSGDRGRKTWVTGPNPRPSHAKLNGETVGINATFSNGLTWPGDGFDPAEVAGCNCSIAVSIGDNS